MGSPRTADRVRPARSLGCGLVSTAEPPSPDRELTLADYGRAIWNGRTIVLTAIVVAALAGLALSFVRSTTYTGTAQVYLGQATTPSGGVVTLPFTNPTIAPTVLEGDAIVDPVAEQTGLAPGRIRSASASPSRARRVRPETCQRSQRSPSPIPRPRPRRRSPTPTPNRSSPSMASASPRAMRCSRSRSPAKRATSPASRASSRNSGPPRRRIPASRAALVFAAQQELGQRPNPTIRGRIAAGDERRTARPGHHHPCREPGFLHQWTAPGPHRAHLGPPGSRRRHDSRAGLERP